METQAVEVKPEVVTVKSMELPPKCIALLKACVSKESSRYAIRHAFVIDGSIYATTGRIAASVTPPTSGKRLADGVYLIVGNAIYQPVDSIGSYPKASEVFLVDDKVEELGDIEKCFLQALINQKVYVDVFKFGVALRVLESMDLNDQWLHIKKSEDGAYPVMISGKYVQQTGNKTHSPSLRSKISGPWGIRVVMMTFAPSDR